MRATRHIAIVGANPAHTAILEDGAREAGVEKIFHVSGIENLPAHIRAVDPDAILIDLATPQRAALEQVFEMSRTIRRPIALFVETSDSETVQASVDAGISAFVVGELRKERVRHVLDLCVSRFNATAKLQAELARAKAALDERKVIDRAKGLLMTAKCLTEDQAYALMRSTAMNENKKIADIAQSIMTASQLLK